MKTPALALGAVLLMSGCSQDVQRDIAQLKSSTQTLSVGLESLSATQATIAADLSRLAGEQEAFARRLGQFELSGASQGVELEKLVAQQAALGETLSALGARLAKTDASVGAVGETMQSAIQPNVDAQRLKLDELGEAIAAFSEREKARDEKLRQLMQELGKAQAQEANAALAGAQRSLAAAKEDEKAQSSGPADAEVAKILTQRFSVGGEAIRGVISYRITAIDEINVLTRGAMRQDSNFGKIWPYKVQVKGVGINTTTDFGRKEVFTTLYEVYLYRDSFGELKAIFRET